MSDKPSESGNPGENPFEQIQALLKALGLDPNAPGAPGGQAGFSVSGFGNPLPGQQPGQQSGQPGSPFGDLSGLLGQFQMFMQPYDGPVNWPAAQDMARKRVAQEPDPSPTDKVKAAIADAFGLADHWLDEATHFPSGITSTAAWSRAEWIVETSPVWQVLVQPIAEQAAGSGLADQLPEEAKAMAGPLVDMLKRASGSMLAAQLGSGLGALAGEVLGASDIGLPLGPAGRAALVPVNVAAFAEGLDGVSSDDVLLYLALREAAHQRLFAHVPWLRDHLISAVADYASGMGMSISGLGEQMQGIDLSDPASLQRLMESGQFEPQQTPQQQEALARLEVTLALVEGWVDDVVALATDSRMPAAAKLREACRRRRAAGGPAEDTFATLVGLELRPRRLRDASTLWASLRDRQGIEARDGVWMSPHLLPTSADLDDPLGFREGAEDPGQLSEEQFDAELQQLLDGGMGRAAEGPTEE